jgi:ABC-type anion transport system duplicated permease subunit
MEISIIVLAGIFAIWLTPFLVVATSQRTSGSEKLAWLLGMLFISWFAWIFYALLAPIKPSEQQRV